MKSFFFKYMVIPCLRNTYPFLTRFLSMLSRCRWPLKLNDRFFLSRHLLSGRTILQFDPSDHLTVKWVHENLLNNLRSENVIPLVIDIGANDDFLSSHSYNMIQIFINGIYADIVFIETFRLDANQFNLFMINHQYKKATVIHWNTIYIKDVMRPLKSDFSPIFSIS